MQGINILVVGGNLAAKPIITMVGDSKKASFMLIANDSQRRVDKETGEVTYVDIARPIYGDAWGPQAETLERFGNTGVPMVLMGRMETDEWQDKDTGEKRRKSFMYCNRVILAGNAPESRLSELRKTSEMVTRARVSGAKTIEDFEKYLLEAIDREMEKAKTASSNGAATNEPVAAESVPETIAEGESNSIMPL